MTFFKPKTPTVIPCTDDILHWPNVYKELQFYVYNTDPKVRAETLGKWQAFIDYLNNGGEAFIHYSKTGNMNGSVGKLTLDPPVTDVTEVINFGDYSINILPVFKISFEGTKSEDFIKTDRGGLRTSRSRHRFDIAFKKPKHCYLTTSTYFKKNIAKENIVHDRYGTQITEGCYVLAAIPGKPPSIESGKITHITDSGILWFQQLGTTTIFKGKLRAKSCVVISSDLVDNILMEKLSS